MPIVATAEQRQISHARQAARRELVRSVQAGMTAREARRCCSVRLHRTTVYRLLKRVEREGEQALAERRHGHPVKLCGEALTFRWTTARTILLPLAHMCRISWLSASASRSA